ncbi:hypothetical protein [Thiorhodovibrio winogradskyi]|nr:hypothetical protein [Thiorhodovibrio winogradskyi]
MRQLLLGVGFIGVSIRSVAAESAAMGARVVGLDGAWLLVILTGAVALAVALMLGERPGVVHHQPASGRNSKLGGRRLLVALLALSGLALLVLADRFFVAPLAGGALLALAWGLHLSARPAGRLSATPTLWLASLVVLMAIIALVGVLLESHAWGAQADQGALMTALRWMLSLPLTVWLAALLFGAMLVEIAGMLLDGLPARRLDSPGDQNRDGRG